MEKLKIIGHRGARGLAPENTLAALKKGLDASADMVEFDLRVTKDGQVVLYHNPRLMGDGNKYLINQHSLASLRRRQPDLATFDEALDLLGGKTPMCIEVKPGVDIKPIVKILKSRLDSSLPTKNVVIASFSQSILMDFKNELPNVRRLVLEKWSGVRATRRAKQAKARLICMDQEWLWFGFIKSISWRYELYAYTVNDPAKAKRWVRWGLSGVVTDYPDRFKA